MNNNTGSSFLLIKIAACIYIKKIKSFTLSSLLCQNNAKSNKHATIENMRFPITSTQDNLQTIMRKAGYRPEGYDRRTGESKFTKSITGAPYPHFHIYCKEQDENITCNLHLDQKKPSYQGSSAHSGEYDGNLVESEVERITHLLS